MYKSKSIVNKQEEKSKISSKPENRDQYHPVNKLFIGYDKDCLQTRRIMSKYLAPPYCFLLVYLLTFMGTCRLDNDIELEYIELVHREDSDCMYFSS